MSPYVELKTVAVSGTPFTGGETEAVVSVNYAAGQHAEALKALNAAYAEARERIEH
ncbi:hypothetical protein [Kribbella sp. CA-293567]|uniref:hypothetical protein n=1 Tax=Kribbella sp. CA-293567 TaxID=3002436 RepID=UPI0022DE79E4|nr:hypothetical protein [Kribbella sp. CA-293567]WBQ03807.1 hypothetical protein OX958_28035 [Kribbella sp. CA-293567]